MTVKAGAPHKGLLSLHTHVLSSKLTPAKRWKQPRWQVSTAWSSPAMDYYSAMKRLEILTQAMTRMNLEVDTLSGVSQSQKDRSYVSALIRGSWGHQSLKAEGSW